MPGTPVFTIGYGARELEEFLAVLHDNQIQYLLDVRTNPYSSFKPTFSKQDLQAFLESHNIHYIFMGDSLGGQPDDNRCYTGGKVDYSKVARQSFFLAGIERLHEASRQGHRVAVMCSEGKPENCHRSKLIGKTLTSGGVEVIHIDEQDQLISQRDVLLRITGGQPSLFGDDFFTFKSRKKYKDGAEDDGLGGDPAR